MGEEDVLELVEEEVPEDFDEEPEDFVLSVYTGHVVEVEALYAPTAFTAVILQSVFGDETLGTNVFHGWELWCFQQG